MFESSVHMYWINQIMHFRCTPWSCPTTTSTPACRASRACSRASTSPSGGMPASISSPGFSADPPGDPSKDSNHTKTTAWLNVEKRDLRMTKSQFRLGCGDSFSPSELPFCLTHSKVPSEASNFGQIRLYSCARVTNLR